MRTNPGWKLFTLLLVLAAHAWLGWTLASYRPDGRLAPTRARQQPPDAVLLVIEFTGRAAPAKPMPVPAQRPQRRQRNPAAARADASATLAGDSAMAVVEASGEPRPLDLRPPPPPGTGFARASPFERAQALSYEPTRYDGAYISTGNLTEVAARRSQVAMVVLSVLGALRKDCTQAQRANYDRACVGAAYEHKPGGD